MRLSVRRAVFVGGGEGGRHCCLPLNRFAWCRLRTASQRPHHATAEAMNMCARAHVTKATEERCEEQPRLPLWPVYPRAGTGPLFGFPHKGFLPQLRRAL